MSTAFYFMQLRFSGFWDRHMVGTARYMKTSVLFVAFILLLSCGAGYHRVKYAEMPMPPKVMLKNNELVVTTRNADGEGLSVYKIDIDIRDRARIIDLKGYQAVGKPEKTEFKIALTEAQLKEIRNYRMYWVDPGGRKNKLVVSDQL
jgi:hypothetical protein